MDTEPVKLSDIEFSELQRSTPDNGSGNAVDRRAIALAYIYLARRHPGSERIPPPAGADIGLKHGNAVISYEVKGTRGVDIGSGKLRVSSLHCYNSLVAGTPVLRISGVFERTPVIRVMHYGTDFILRPEPRWTLSLIKPSRPDRPRQLPAGRSDTQLSDDSDTSTAD